MSGGELLASTELPAGSAANGRFTLSGPGFDDAGIPRRTRVTYDIQDIDFELESRVRPVEAVNAVRPPPASEIVSSHTATDAVHLQQLIASHIAQHAAG